MNRHGDSRAGKYNTFATLLNVGATIKTEPEPCAFRNALEIFV